MSSAFIDALKIERAGYVLRGLPARVAAVDAEIARLGGAPAIEKATAPVEPETASLTARARKGR